MEVGLFVQKDLPFLQTSVHHVVQPPSISSRNGRAIPYDHSHFALANTRKNVEDLDVTLSPSTILLFYEARQAAPPDVLTHRLHPQRRQ